MEKEKSEKDRKRRKKRVIAVTCAVALFFLCAFGLAGFGVVYAEKSWTNWYPDYEKTDIAPLLDKAELTDEDYRILYAQTGLTKLGIDDLLFQNKRSLILEIQNSYFHEYKINPLHFGPFSYMEETDGFATITQLQNGDVLLSASTRVSWFRYGHSAIVVDGAEGLIVECVSLGNKSEISGTDTFSNRANFLVLRPRVEKALREEVAAYAKDELVGIPYRLTTGIFSKKNENVLKGSQCGHLVWYAYKQFGVDLDATGGGVVTPRDIANSDKVDVVQVFGFDPNVLWR